MLLVATCGDPLLFDIVGYQIGDKCRYQKIVTTKNLSMYHSLKFGIPIGDHSNITIVSKNVRFLNPPTHPPKVQCLRNI